MLTLQQESKERKKSSRCSSLFSSVHLSFHFTLPFQHRGSDAQLQLHPLSNREQCGTRCPCERGDFHLCIQVNTRVNKKSKHQLCLYLDLSVSSKMMLVSYNVLVTPHVCKPGLDRERSETRHYKLQQRVTLPCVFSRQKISKRLGRKKECDWIFIKKKKLNKNTVGGSRRCQVVVVVVVFFKEAQQTAGVKLTGGSSQGGDVACWGRELILTHVKLSSDREDTMEGDREHWRHYDIQYSGDIDTSGLTCLLSPQIQLNGDHNTTHPSLDRCLSTGQMQPKVVFYIHSCQRGNVFRNTT